MSKDISFKTRLSAASTAITTTATIDWKDVTDEQLKTLATRSVIIAQQAVYRSSEIIPTKDTIKVAELLKREKGGFKLTPENVGKKLESMELTPDDKAKLIKLLQGK